MTPRPLRLAVFLVLCALLPGCNEGSTSEATGPGSAGSAGPSPTSDVPNDAHHWMTIDSDRPGELTAGRYALPAIGSKDGPLAVVDLPDGYQSWGPFVFADEPDEPDDPLALGLWAVDGIYRDACAGNDLARVSTVRGLAASLVDQRHTTTSDPRPVRLAGYRGVYLELTSPTHLNYATCNDAEVNYWRAGKAGDRWTRMPGMLDQLWILNVHGHPLVWVMAVPPSASTRQVERLTDIAEHVRLVHTQHGWVSAPRLTAARVCSIVASPRRCHRWTVR